MEIQWRNQQGKIDEFISGSSQENHKFRIYIFQDFYLFETT